MNIREILSDIHALEEELLQFEKKIRHPLRDAVRRLYGW